MRARSHCRGATRPRARSSNKRRVATTADVQGDTWGRRPDRRGAEWVRCVQGSNGPAGAVGERGCGRTVGAAGRGAMLRDI